MYLSINTNYYIPALQVCNRDIIDSDIYYISNKALINKSVLLNNSRLKKIIEYTYIKEKLSLFSCDIEEIDNNVFVGQNVHIRDCGKLKKMSKNFICIKEARLTSVKFVSGDFNDLHVSFCKEIGKKIIVRGTGFFNDISKGEALSFFGEDLFLKNWEDLNEIKGNIIKGDLYVRYCSNLIKVPKNIEGDLLLKNYSYIDFRENLKDVTVKGDFIASHLPNEMPIYKGRFIIGN